MAISCPRCGEAVAPQAHSCGHCGADVIVRAELVPGSSLVRPAHDLGQDPAIRMLLPVGRSVWAIAAGYFGLFSLIGCGAPPAIFCGIMALRDIRRNPQLHGQGRAIFGIVMGVIGMVPLVAMIAGLILEVGRR